MKRNPMRQTLDNKAIYRRTLGFSLRRGLWDLVSLILIVALAAVGFLVADKNWSMGPAGMAIGLIIGFIVLAIIMRFVSYSLKAGQIAMMTRGITEGELPDDVIGEGKRVVKERFATVAAFYAVTGVIKGIFSQLGRALTKLGEKTGGDAGSAVGSAVSSAIQTVVSYLCDCCLGWVFYHKSALLYLRFPGLRQELGKQLSH